MKDEKEQVLFYPIFGNEDGNYVNDIACKDGNYIAECSICKGSFVGHRDRTICKKCSDNGL